MSFTLEKALWYGAGFFAIRRIVRSVVGPNPFVTKVALFPTTFDPVFRGCPLPNPYLRALAKHESDFNASENTGCCIGLLQVHDVVRQDFNRRNGTALDRAQLLDPTVNVLVACDHLMTIGRALARNHPAFVRRDSSGGIDFTDRTSVGIFTLAWNAGHSEGSGMGRALTVLESQGFRAQDLLTTLDRIRIVAQQNASVSDFLADPNKHGFAQRVTRDFFRQLGL